MLQARTILKETLELPTKFAKLFQKSPLKLRSVIYGFIAALMMKFSGFAAIWLSWLRQNAGYHIDNNTSTFVQHFYINRTCCLSKVYLQFNFDQLASAVAKECGLRFICVKVNLFCQVEMY